MHLEGTLNLFISWKVKKMQIELHTRWSNSKRIFGTENEYPALKPL